MCKILILVLIISIVIIATASAMMLHLLSDRNAKVDAIFSNVTHSGQDIEIRDRKWEDRQWLMDREYTIHSIKSFDGIELKAKYVKASGDSDRCAICVHGFHSNGYKEFSSIGRFYLENGINVLFVDQRGNGESGGRMITYGDREQRDILQWVDYAIANLTDNAYFSLHGISMGSATVMLISDRVPSDKIKYIAADCGYTYEKDQLLYTIKTIGLPARILYFCYMMACQVTRLYNPNNIAPVEHAKNTKVPMIFAHGRDDQIVPVAMAEELYERCGFSKKKLVIADGANHTQAFYMTEEYGKALIEFMG